MMGFCSCKINVWLDIDDRLFGFGNFMCSIMYFESLVHDTLPRLFLIFVGFSNR